MLFAELHGKLAPDQERDEDILTSTVIGTLITADSGLLGCWLGRARNHLDEKLLLDPVERPCGYWFWPRLIEAEPDFLVRFGDLLICIEAKYLSNRSDLNAGRHAPEGGGSDATARDQLVREWRSITHYSHAAACPADLRSAVTGTSRKALVFLVSASKLRRARRELWESAARLGEQTSLYLLTWQELHRLLRDVPAASEAFTWQYYLRRFLERRGLATFGGFLWDGKAITPDLQLGLRPSRPSMNLPVLFASGTLDLVQRLASISRSSYSRASSR